MKRFLKVLSYVAVALLASALTLTGTLYWGRSMEAPRSGESKLNQLQDILDTYFIEDVDRTALEDAAAKAMIQATGDRWSYYIPAADYQSYRERAENAYVGVGITISPIDNPAGFEIVEVVPGGPAAEAGLEIHDILIQIEGKSCADLGMEGTKDLVRGEEGTSVRVTVLRDGQEKEFSVSRRRFETPVATYELLDSGYGLITIENFESKCAEETLAAIEALTAQGAKGLIFDVRFNPGGFKDELVKVLDYLLPEGPLFRSVTYDGQESTDYSDAAHLELPMAVLVNQDSYSAAEFFAAALQEYGAAKVVGTQTSGKGYFQNTFRLLDGSAAAISTGKYFTPHGNSLAGVGITPDVPAEVEEKTNAAIYYGELEPADDPQIQAAISALNSAVEP